MVETPAFYDPERVGTLFIPRTQEAVLSGQQAGLSAADQDETRIILLLVDPQVDFIHTDGSLCVPGAIEDTRRTIEWIFRNANQLTAIAASLDSHIPTQIFYATWWVNAGGEHPAPFTVITGEQVDAGIWQPVYEVEWSRDYVHRLSQQARKQLMIWPYHTMIGTLGQAITPALYEAIAYHAAARRSQPIFLNKGSLPQTEHYSLLEPEVKVANHPQGNLNTAFLQMLASYDRVYIAGQAKSHCVLETVTSIMRYFGGQPEQIAKWRLLTDCMSSVTHPMIDFDALADENISRFFEQGLTLTTSNDPVS